MPPLSKTAKKHTGAMLALMAPPTIVRKMRKAKMVEDKDLLDCLHLTLLYLGPSTRLKKNTLEIIQRAVEKVCARHEPLEMRISGAGTFIPEEDGTPVYVVPNAKGLSALQADLENVVGSIIDLPSKHGWVPHMTVGYSCDDEPELPDLTEKLEWTADKVRFQVGGEKLVDIPIGRRKKGMDAPPLSKRAIQIKKEMIPILWYENEKGEKHVPTENQLKGNMSIPDGFLYQHSQFPTTLTHNVLRLTVMDEVDSCQHPEASIQQTDGWVDGVEGRECNKCGGTQTKSKDQPWPKKWSSNGSRHVMTVNNGWSEDLVLAIANSGDWNLRDAILVVANSCERCMNALAHKYGLKWGYPEFGDEWKKTGTSCEFCESDSKSKSACKTFPFSKQSGSLPSFSKRAALEAVDFATWMNEQLADDEWTDEDDAAEMTLLAEDCLPSIE